MVLSLDPRWMVGVGETELTPPSTKLKCLLRKLPCQVTKELRVMRKLAKEGADILAKAGANTSFPAPKLFCGLKKAYERGIPTMGTKSNKTSLEKRASTMTSKKVD